MRKRRKVGSFFGAILMGAGITVLMAVLLILYLPPRVPEEFREHSSPPQEIVPDFELAASVNEIPADDNTQVKAEASLAGDPLSTSPRIIPDGSSRMPALSPEDVPGIKQNELLVTALAQMEAEQDRLSTEPLRISIPALGIEAPVRAVGLRTTVEDDETVLQWAVPNEYAVGWHHTSAPLRTPGNTVLNGHNNVFGAVFHNLVDLELGDRVILYDEEGSYEYEVTEKELFEEDEKSLSERRWNARWMLPTSDERLTIITCWPNTTNSHRLVVVAQPVDDVGT